MGHIPSCVLADIPRAGLGHRLFVWARALVFARINDLPLLVAGWNRFAIGPMLRRERRSRLYVSYFRGDGCGPLVRAMAACTLRRVVEPPIERLSGAQHGQKACLYVFTKAPHWSDYFGVIKPHRDYVRDHLMGMIRRRHYRLLADCARPVVGLHIRMGDYRPLRPGEDFSTAGGHVRTPLSYYGAAVRALREIHGSELPVSVFTDGYPDELREVLDLPGVSLVDTGSDIADLLLLSRSDVMVGSNSSFAFWAAFLSERTVLMHPLHFWSPTRPDGINARAYEGRFTPDVHEWPEQLVHEVHAIRREY